MSIEKATTELVRRVAQALDVPARALMQPIEPRMSLKELRDHYFGNDRSVIKLEETQSHG